MPSAVEVAAEEVVVIVEEVVAAVKEAVAAEKKEAAEVAVIANSHIINKIGEYIRKHIQIDDFR